MFTRDHHQRIALILQELNPERTAQASFSDQPFRVVVSGRMVERQTCINLLRVVNNLHSGAAGAAAADPSMQLS